MTKKHMKKCLKSLAIKEMQIKTTLRFYLAVSLLLCPVRGTRVVAELKSLWSLTWLS
jgi:hypothetical protein